MGKLVSAIITTHNRVDLVKRAIESVLWQTYPNIECIVVSDNSTDGTNEYCQNRKDITFINIKPEESKGGNYARNLGIQAAQGAYIAFLDDDDCWLSSKIEKQVELLEAKKCECVYCLRKYEYIHEHGVKEFYESLDYAIEGDIHSIIFRHSFTSTSCLLTTKSILEKVGGFDNDLIKMQEYELLIRIAQLTPVFYVHDDYLVLYRIDKKDRNRVSSSFYKLPIAKNFIEKKHRDLLKRANIIDRILHYDWMMNAMYKAAKSDNVLLVKIQYAPYYIFSKILHKMFKKFK